MENVTGKKRAIIYDQSCPQWNAHREFNRLFLKSQEKYLNDVLTYRGHVFLNEVHDALGVPRTSAGQLEGWYKGGNRIDFEIQENDKYITVTVKTDGVIYDRL